MQELPRQPEHEGTVRRIVAEEPEEDADRRAVPSAMIAMRMCANLKPR